jgi:glyceraldehyde 3-phosphate dehydrogenase
LGALRGAKRVVISAPAKDDTPMLVMGVNHTLYNPEVSGVASSHYCAPCVLLAPANFADAHNFVLLHLIHSSFASLFP